MLTALAVEKVAENGQAIANSLYQDVEKPARARQTRGEWEWKEEEAQQGVLLEG